MTIFAIGTPSVAEMCAAAAASPYVGPLPRLYMTSGVRDVPQPYHGTENATDWGDNADQVLGSPQLDQHAQWLATFYGPWSLELIHNNQGAGDAGIYWKNGVKVDPTFFGDATDQQHAGHVHWAITVEGLAAAAAWWRQIAALTGEQVQLPVVDPTKAINMAHPWVRRLQGLMQANGLMLLTANVDKPVLIQGIKRVQEINGWAMTGIADDHVWNWLLRPVP